MMRPARFRICWPASERRGKGAAVLMVTMAPREPGLLARIWRHRTDYLYVAPALAVMLLVIGYPVYYTIYLSFFNTPPSLAMSQKIFVGVDNYVRILTSQAFRDV